MNLSKSINASQTRACWTCAQITDSPLSQSPKVHSDSFEASFGRTECSVSRSSRGQIVIRSRML